MISKIVLIGFGLLLISKSQANARIQKKIRDNTLDPSNWGADQWTRLSGGDLTLDGNHPAPSGFDIYGMSYEMGWGTPGYAPPGVN